MITDQQFKNFWESVYPREWRIKMHYFTETDNEVDWLEKEKLEHEQEMRRLNSRSVRAWQLDFGLIKLNNKCRKITAEEIKELTNIVDIISEFIKLERSGSRFVAKCPLHNEKTASFYVFPQTRSWHCFGCSSGGSVIDFIMQINKLDFKEALSYLESLL